MFDRLVEEATMVSQWLGDTGVLPGLVWIGDHLDEYDEDFQKQYRGFMRMGRELFAPVRG